MTLSVARYLLILPALLLSLPLTGAAANVDLAISANSVRFSEQTLYAGETVRIYATIRNNGQVDTAAQVFFYTSDKLIGESQTVSVLANGGADDVYIDFKLPESSFNIRAVIQGSTPADTNPANDVALTPLFKTIADDDRDGVLNADDNCKTEANEDQTNLDGDNKGDACDSDLDGDGVGNNDDDFPRDPSKSKREVAPPAPKDEPVTPPAPKVEAPVAAAPTAAVEPAAVASTTDEPVPEVKGVQTAEAELAAPVEVSLDFSTLGHGQTLNSPAASFSFRQVDWRTYDFVAIPPLGGGDYTYAWDFGDGSTSVQTAISHQFPASGVYMVTLATVAADGTVTSDTQELSVSFFHLANPMLLATIAILVMTMIGLIVIIVRLRRGEEV
jgi:hypothetical protein